MTVHTRRGRYYEEMIPGDVFKHEPGRTITEADNVLFCSITINTQSLHLDAVKSAESEFGQRLVNSLLTLGIVCSIGVPDLTQKTTTATQTTMTATSQTTPPKLSSRGERRQNLDQVNLQQTMKKLLPTSKP